jgi:hypothetical protein
MFSISKNAYKILKKLYTHKDFNIKPSDMSDLSALIKEGLLKLHKNITTDNLKKDASCLSYVTITHNGIIYIETIKNQRKQFWIPLVLSSTLSVIAIIISIFSLLKP